MAKPTIRFKGYTDDWEQRKLGDVLERRIEQRQQSEEYPRLAFASGQGVIPLSERKTNNREQLTKDEYTKKYLVTELNDIVYNPANVKYGAIDRNKCGRGLISPIYVTFTTNEIPGFIERIVTSHDFQQRALRFEEGTVTKRQSVNPEDLVTLDILVAPKREEQQKIATYFDSLDHLITLHQRKCEETKILKKYMLQKMFPQNGQKVPEIRFKGFTDDWEQRKLGDLVDRVTRKNQDLVSELPLTISAQYGLIDQNEFFDKRVASKDVSGYYLIENGEFAYNKSTSTDAPWGAIKRLDRYENGVLSTLYIVFGIKENNPIDSDFLVSYYSTNLWHKGIHEIATEGARNHGLLNIAPADFFETKLMIPQDIEEQKKIGKYFEELERLITLHQRKPYFWNKFIVIDWEQRKLPEFVSFFNGLTYTPDDVEETGTLVLRSSNVKNGEIVDADNVYVNDKVVTSENVHEGDIIVVVRNGSRALIGKHAQIKASMPNTVIGAFMSGMRSEHSSFVNALLDTSAFENEIAKNMGATINQITGYMFSKMEFMIPSGDEQQKIGEHFQSLDNLITLHHHKLFIINGLKLFTVMQCKCHLLLNISNKNKKTIKEIKLMPELERVIEEKLIDQLVYGDSQWTYREDLKTEEDLWRNFKYILEQNNKDRLNGESLSDAEFEQVKNQLQFSSFYKAGEWLVGENGKVMVHVQRDTEKLHLVVMNHEHIAGGSSVYEVINQYSALKDEDDYYTVSRNRRFDVTLMINGLPMIHIELKNRQHSYMDGFNQIKKYISEGKFTGIFSAVQMFVVSNGVDTKYFAAASDTDLNAKFMSGWVDEKNNPVSDYLDFAKSVLRIPEAHEMIARYTVLDRDAKRLIILRPYQIHAIESIREASKIGKSGFVWHTTGSGKTLTSYKATRNLLMDIPSLDKTIFLIDRKDLDTQTSSAFQAYANNDVIAVDKTDNVNDLKKKLKSGDRKVIVTTIQKMQILVTKRLQEDTPEYNKIKNLRIAFVVDECHRAVTPKTKRELERFFGRSLWFGFTGTPRFAENPYAQMGDLPRTTEELYGKCLHKYTIQNAIKDNAVLGFQVEHNGPKNMEDETDPSLYDNETHMLRVLDIILNKSYQKFGLQNGKGQTYEAILTTSSIQLAQKYYELLSKVKNGETDLEIDERMRKVLPDYPKFAITYSVTENEEGSHVNQEKMQKSLNDYNEMFGTKFDLSQIQSYNENLNKRLARKDKKYKSRNRQLDLVIVVDRLLTGFDAPCLSTIFIDRQPMGPHDLIQAFSRTNRIFDPNKAYGQIVTFQAPVLFKECVDNAVKLYSAGSTEVALLAEWDKVEPAFKRALSALKAVAETPDEETDMSLKELKVFAKAFQTFDRLFAQIKSFTQYDESMLEDYGITEEEYEDYVGHYQNAMTKIKLAEPDDPQTPPEAEETVDTDYELMAYSSTKIDYEYIINLIQNIVTPDEDAEAVTPEERQKQIDEVKQYIEEMRKDNPKVADIMTTLVNEIEQDENKYKGQSIMNIVENMKHDCINQVVTDFCVTWYASKDDVMYAALHYRNGEIPNESVIKSTINYTRYKESQEKALPKFKYYSQCMAELRKILDEEIKPLITVS